EYGYRLREVKSRDILEEGFTPTGVNPCKSPLPTEKQDGYTVHNLFLSWEATPELEFRAALDNATNEEYDIENGQSTGSPAPGRALRASVSYRF
ncbi:MAG: hypothetical protein AAF512_17560, partial [Pseudomonadota bacterium]